jgi:hypothetical protein
METAKTKMDDELRLLGEKTRATLSKVLQETPKTPVSGGVGSVSRPTQTLLNLHNYRLIYDFKRTDQLEKSILPFIKPNQKGSGAITMRLLNSNSTIQVCDFEDCNLYIKRQSIEVRYKPISERWHLFNHGEKGEQEYLKITREMNIKGKAVVQKFIDMYGGESQLSLQNIYIHNKAIDENIAKIPRRLKFGNNVVQKQYNDINLEWLDPQSTINYLTNEGVRELLPSLCNSINQLSYNILTVNPLRALKMLCKSPIDAIQYPQYVELLTDLEKHQLVTYWFRCSELEVKGG